MYINIIFSTRYTIGAGFEVQEDSGEPAEVTNAAIRNQLTEEEEEEDDEDFTILFLLYCTIMLDTITSVLKRQILCVSRNEKVNVAKVVNGFDKQIK